MFNMCLPSSIFILGVRAAFAPGEKIGEGGRIAPTPRIGEGFYRANRVYNNFRIINEPSLLNPP
ncbi:hypothetical protein J2129_000813 [Methanofollis sp. W23]|nr:hypothetical protein [Methanofollis sp. W23]